MSIPMWFDEVGLGVYEGRCGRARGHGGCDGSFGNVPVRPFAGTFITEASFDKEGELLFQSVRRGSQPRLHPWPGFRPDDRGVLKMTRRAKSQWQNRDKLSSHRGRSKGIALGRREAPGSPTITQREVDGYMRGGRLAVSNRRMKPVAPVPPPVEAECPSCGFINEWDGGLPS